MRTAVVIPQYKKPVDLSKDEVAFFNSTLKVLNQRKIYLIIPESLEKFWVGFVNIELITFSDSYFVNKFSYSKLLCKRIFYEAFTSFDFIQIAQTDCWVFEDKIDYFASLGFDYIGAPWMEGGFDGNPQQKLWKVGNGGFSLRKVGTFLSIIDTIENGPEGKTPVFKNRRWGIKGVLKNLGIRNNLKHYVEEAPGEDIFWSIYVTQVFGNDIFKIADPKTAAHYSFEVHPEFLFREITRGQLPMGCHNWKNNNPSFWKEYIKY